MELDRHHRHLVVGALLTMLLAACGGGGGAPDRSTGPDTSADGAADDVDPTGVLRYAYGLAEVNLDPIFASTPADFTYQHLAYDTLLRESSDGKLHPGLATGASIVDPRTIEIELRPDVTFQDGATFDAEAVKAGLQRNIDAKNQTGAVGAGRAFPTELSEIVGIEVTAPLTLRLHLGSDAAGVVYPLLAGNASQIVSPAASGDPDADLRSSPAGAGPFTVERFSPEEVISFRKWDGFWDASSIRLGGVDMVHVADPVAAANALQADAVDAVFVGAEGTEPFEGGSTEIDVRPSDNSIYWLPICKSRPPFDDLRVRQALNYALDRDAINAALFGGLGEPQWGVWTSGHVLHPDGIDGRYDHDPALARALLEEAGATDLRLDLMTLPTPSVTRFAELVQQQYAAVGIDVQIKPSANIVQDFFIDAKAPLATIPYVNRGITKLAGNFFPGSLANICKYDDPAMNALIDQLRSVGVDSDDGIRLWKEAQTYVAEQALVVHGVFTPQANAWNGDRLGGVTFRPDALGRPTLDFLTAYVRR